MISNFVTRSRAANIHVQLGGTRRDADDWIAKLERLDRIDRSAADDAEELIDLHYRVWLARAELATLFADGALNSPT